MDPRTPRNLVCSPCADDAMLEEVLRFEDRFLARAASITDDEVRRRFRRCPTAFHCILNTANDTPELCGYFILLPLTSTCAAAIRQGIVTTGRQIGLSDLVPQQEAAEAVYLSVACAVGIRSRAALIGAGIDAIRHLYEHRGTRALFARAATAEGARMLTRLTRERFTADGVIHEIDLSRYETLTVPE